jgi:hypothetical protein
MNYKGFIAKKSQSGTMGGFNRSSQHRIIEQILDTHSELHRLFSRRVFFGVTLTTHGTSYLGLIMRLGVVYETRGDSADSSIPSASASTLWRQG